MEVYTDQQGKVEYIPPFDPSDGYLQCEWLLWYHPDARHGANHGCIRMSQIRLVFAAVKETILQNALRDSGIL